MGTRAEGKGRRWSPTLCGKEGFLEEKHPDWVLKELSWYKKDSREKEQRMKRYGGKNNVVIREIHRGYCVSVCVCSVVSRERSDRSRQIK